MKPKNIIIFGIFISSLFGCLQKQENIQGDFISPNSKLTHADGQTVAVAYFDGRDIVVIYTESGKKYAGSREFHRYGNKVGASRIIFKMIKTTSMLEELRSLDEKTDATYNCMYVSKLGIVSTGIRNFTGAGSR